MHLNVLGLKYRMKTCPDKDETTQSIPTDTSGQREHVTAGSSKLSLRCYRAAAWTFVCVQYVTMEWLTVIQELKVNLLWQPVSVTRDKSIH